MLGASTMKYSRQGLGGFPSAGAASWPTDRAGLNAIIAAGGPAHRWLLGVRFHRTGIANPREAIRSAFNGTQGGIELGALAARAVSALRIESRALLDASDWLMVVDACPLQVVVLRELLHRLAELCASMDGSISASIGGVPLPARARPGERITALQAALDTAQSRGRWTYEISWGCVDFQG